jgi:enoyl-CoA hydratase/carnithine racemase
MSYQTILYEERGGVALVTLNRPERMNAWTYQMSAELVQAITAANDNRQIGAIVVTGAGRGFCAGADMQDTFQARIDGRQQAAPQTRATDWVGFVRRSKPLIAAVNGAAVGVGVTLMLPFDIIIASDKARFGLAFVKMGVVPELASSHYLPQRVGFGNASEMCLTGRLYSAQEAFEKGLANRVAPAEKLLEEAMALAGEIAANPSLQLGMVKELLTQNAAETNIALVQEREMKLLHQAYESAEHKEAVAAFLQKRTPDFRKL